MGVLGNCPVGPLVEFGGLCGLDKKHTHLQLLGTGSFGQVVLARNCLTDEVVAIKVLRRGDVSKYLEREILNHSQLRHPHVIQFKEVFLTPGHVCIAMEFASGGTLFNYMQRAGRLHEPVARWFFQQLMLGVDYCHRRGVANRDLKLENTLLQNAAQLPLPLVKICDFGYSKCDGDTAAKSKVGTSAYMAPEILIRHTSSDTYDGKMADVWSCGVMLFVMVCGCYPFGPLMDKDGRAPPTHEVIRILERMLSLDYAFPPDVQLSADCSDLLTRMLSPDPGSRIKVAEVLDHPWFKINLPPDALEMNERYLAAAPPDGGRDLEEIRRVIAEARGAEGAARAAAAQHAAARAAALRAEAQDEARRAAGRAARRAVAGDEGAGGGAGGSGGAPACCAPAWPPAAEGAGSAGGAAGGYGLAAPSLAAAGAAAAACVPPGAV